MADPIRIDSSFRLPVADPTARRSNHHRPALCLDCGGATSAASASRCRSCYLVRRARRSAERFWSLVDTSGGMDACWTWLGMLTKLGYGRVAIARDVRVYAHRHMYELVVGPVPEGLDLDHLCHTKAEHCAGGPTCPHRSCVNPAHLEPVTPAENTARGARTRFTGFCRRGHALGEAGRVRRAPRRGSTRDRSRECLTCHRDAENRRRGAA